MIIAVDVDGVVADLITEVLFRYNQDYRDHLRLDDITEWDIAQFVKPECGTGVYSYFEQPDIYGNVIPITHSRMGIARLMRAGHRIVYVTTPAPHTAGIKAKWLSVWSFMKDEANYIECRDKSLVRADILIDDGIHNLRVFHGERIIFTQPWNQKDSVNGSFRADNWHKAVEIVLALQSAV